MFDGHLLVVKRECPYTNIFLIQHFLRTVSDDGFDGSFIDSNNVANTAYCGGKWEKLDR
jgi:hypothetical protein